MLIALNHLITRKRHRLGMLAAVSVLAFGVLSAHSAMGADHMRMGGKPAAGMCLAVIELALAVGLMAVVIRRRKNTATFTWAPRPARSWPAAAASTGRLAAARGSPAFLQVMRR